MLHVTCSLPKSCIAGDALRDSYGLMFDEKSVCYIFRFWILIHCCCMKHGLEELLQSYPLILGRFLSIGKSCLLFVIYMCYATFAIFFETGGVVV